MSIQRTTLTSIVFLISIGVTHAQHPRHYNPDYQSTPDTLRIDERLGAKKDSLQSLPDSLRQKKDQALSPLRQTRDSVQQLLPDTPRPGSPVEKINQKKNEKLNGLERKTKPNAVNTIQQEMPSNDARFAGQGADLSTSPPSVQSATDLPTGQTRLPASPDASLPSPDLTSTEGSLPGQPKVPQALSDLSEKAAPIQQAGGQAGQYKEGVTKNGVDKTIDGQAGQIEQLQPLQQQSPGNPLAVSGTAVPGAMPSGAIPGSNGLPTVNLDMKNQVLEKATSHFAQHPEALTEAKAKLFRLKRRRPDPPVPTTEVKPLSQRAKNPMKGQPLRLRLRPALMLHFLNSEAKSLDISPQLTYQATGRLAVGVGVTHRQFFQLDFPVFPNYAHIYGGRVLAEYSLWKSFFAHAELESLHRPAGTSLAGDAHHQQWVKNVPIGLGKHFSLGKRIQAQTLMMYSVTNPAYNLYPTRWLFRMGFKLMPKETSKEKEKTNSASSESTTHL